MAFDCLWMAGNDLREREGVGQPREASHAHPHREVLPLDVAGADVRRIGIARDLDFPRPRALGWAVARLGLSSLIAVELHEPRNSTITRR